MEKFVSQTLLAFSSSLQTTTGVGRAFGTCGELAQGQFSSGEDFLITLPVNLWSEIHVTLDADSNSVRGDLQKQKTRLAIRKTLNALGFSTWGAAFYAQSELPEGKGMASSSADIVAACRAVSSALGVALSAEEISRIAIDIEPTDGVMYSGVVCYNHRQGRLLESFGDMPPARILILDTGNQVDTVAFNRIPKLYTRDEIQKIHRAYQLIKDGLQEKSLERIGLGATLSAEVNQRMLPKPHFEEILRVAKSHGASGVCAAHSGTVLGLLFARDEIHKMENARRSILEIDGSMNIFETQTL
jgi:L-threonine kinase